jgi:hypothetical protein
MSGEATFLRMPRSKPKTSAEGQEQLSHSLARMASAPIAGRRVPITEIGFGQCRFVIDDRSFPALCCGEPTLGGSWCAQHRALVFVRVAAPNHRKAAQEPIKPVAGEPAPVPAPNGPAKPDLQAKRPDGAKQPSVTKPPRQDLGPPGGAPAKSAEPLQRTTSKKDGAGADKGSGRKEAGRAPARGNERPASIKAPAPAGKSAAAKPAKKAAKRPAAKKPPAKKTAAKAKSSAVKRLAPAKKAAAARKGAPAKRATSAKKSAAGRKRKGR